MSKRDPKVLLVYPPNQLINTDMPRPDGSLGPLYLAGALRRANIEVELLDAAIGGPEDSLKETFFKRVKQSNGLTRIGMSREHLQKHIANGAYDIVGIHSNFTMQTKKALEVAEMAKIANPEILVVAGGVNARALAKRMLSQNTIDIIALTEGEKIIVEAVNAWKNNSDVLGIDGIVYKKNDEFKMNPMKPDTTETNLDNLPMPAWDLLQFAKYDEMDAPPHGSITQAGEQKRRYAPMMTSRGCPFKCLYCHISEEKSAESTAGDIGSLRLKSVGRVMQEVDILRSLGVTHLYLEDDSLLAKKTRVTDLFKRLAGMGMKISAVNGVNLVHLSTPTTDKKLKPDKEYLEIIKASGLDEMSFPVESASQRVLDKYATGKLNHEKLDVVELVRTAVSVGIACPVNMMIGFPDETEAEMLQSVEMGKRLIDAGAPYVVFFIPIPFPGSKLFDMVIKNNHLPLDFDPDTMNFESAIMQNTVVPPKRVEELRTWAWETVNTDSYKNPRRAKSVKISEAV